MASIVLLGIIVGIILTIYTVRLLLYEFSNLLDKKKQDRKCRNQLKKLEPIVIDFEKSTIESTQIQIREKFNKLISDTDIDTTNILADLKKSIKL